MNIALMTRSYFVLIVMALVWPWSAEAQHQHGTPTQQASTTQPSTPQQQPSSQSDMSGMDMSGHDMEHATNLELGFASGTAWQAQSSPEYMWMTKRGQWQLMAHGQL